MPQVRQDTDTTSFTALLNSPLDSSATGSPITELPVAVTSPPVIQTVGQNDTQFQGLQRQRVDRDVVPHRDGPYRQLKPQLQPRIELLDVLQPPPVDIDSDPPTPKRRRRSPSSYRPTPFIREVQADWKKQAERAAAAEAAAAANPGSSTVDLTDGMSDFPSP
jgi:hypothetical protein